MLKEMDWSILQSTSLAFAWADRTNPSTFQWDWYKIWALNFSNMKQAC